MTTETTLANIERRQLSDTEQKLLNFLAAGADQQQAAKALGLSASRVSQLVADEEFSSQLAEAQFLVMSKATARDDKYDALEDKLLEKLDRSLPMMAKPMEIVRTLAEINKAKRRSREGSTPIVQPRGVQVNILLPTKVIQEFTVSNTNQVVKAGEQVLVTMQSGTLLKEVEQDISQRAALSLTAREL